MIREEKILGEFDEASFSLSLCPAVQSLLSACFSCTVVLLSIVQESYGYVVQHE